MPHVARIALLLSLAGTACEATKTTGPAPESAASSADMPEISLPYETFTLDNGLRVVVHEDRKAPVVAVSVWYGVGSADEPPGRTGFAHLFEHLMFQGSENYDGEWFAPLEEVGATDLNGTTWLDRTNYFETVPTPALERALWMESDRMGHLLGAVTQAKLDEQRGVVQNEKRQGDNQPYGLVDYALDEGLFPKDHPYHHSTIGSMEDLEAADLPTVKAWFEKYYGAANTVLSLVGDIDAETARPLVVRYFGDIEPGPPLQKATARIPDRPINTADVLEDANAAKPKIYRAWVVPDRNDRGSALTTLAIDILGDGKTSRLFQSLVYDKQLATEASAQQWDFVLAGQARAEITVEDEATLEEAEAALDKVLARFVEEGPTEAELQRAKTKIAARIIRGLEQAGGFRGKAAILAQGLLYSDDPGFMTDTWLPWIEEATVQDVQQAAQRWLQDGWQQVTVLPYRGHAVTPTAVDRSEGLPEVGEMPGLTFPEIEETTLSTGTKVVFARRDAVPMVRMAVQFGGGYTADAGGRLGTASFATEMLDEGTTTRSALEITAEAEALGAEIRTNTGLDASTVGLTALSANLVDSVALWADVVRNPTFPEDEVERIRKRWLASIAREKTSPFQLALRLLPPIMYGETHPYGVPLTGSGTEASIAALTRDDLVGFQKAWLRPDNATVFVVGDTSLDEITSLLEASFAGWTAEGEQPSRELPKVGLPAEPRLIVVNRPGSPQSMILAGHLMPPPSVDNDLAIESMNDVFGGKFSSRINLNLREDKSWAYGARSVLFDAAGQRPWLTFAPVQSDRTGDSIQELLKEFSQIQARRPITTDELQAVVEQRVNQLPGQFETGDAVLGSIVTNARLGRPLDHAATLPEQYAELQLAEVRQAAKSEIVPRALTWVVVGDREVIDKQLARLPFEEIEYWTLDGTPVE